VDRGLAMRRRALDQAETAVRGGVPGEVLGLRGAGVEPRFGGAHAALRIAAAAGGGVGSRSGSGFGRPGKRSTRTRPPFRSPTASQRRGLAFVVLRFF